MVRLTALIAALALCLPLSAHAQIAEELYPPACEGGDLNACNVFGLMLEYGNGVQEDAERASGFYGAACEGGMLVGCTNLGLLYGRGVGLERDFNRALGQYRVACEGGDPLGCELLEALNQADRPDDDERFIKAGRVAQSGDGALLSGVLVSLPELDLRRISDAQGNVSFDDLPPGEYEVKAERVGYEPTEGTLQVPGRSEFLILMDPFTEQLEEPGGIVGRVTDEDGHGLANVDVRVVGPTPSGTASSQQGRFEVEDLEAGLTEVRFSRLGYAPRTALLVVQAGRTAELSVEMPTQAIELDPIEVTVRPRALEQAGFYDRRQKGFGTQFDRDSLDHVINEFVSDAVRRVPGLRVNDPYRQTVGYHAYATNPRVVGTLGPCVLPVYMDGVLMADKDLNQFPPSILEAIEVYTGGQVPPQYQLMNPCGVVLLWSKK